MTHQREIDEPWHFDKRIPLAMIGAIFIQTGAAFWWASSINERVSALEAWRQDTKEIGAEIAVLKSQIGDLKSILSRIDARLRSDQTD